MHHIQLNVTKTKKNHNKFITSQTFPLVYNIYNMLYSMLYEIKDMYCIYVKHI